MTPIQKKSIRHAIKILNDIRYRGFYPSNFSTPEALTAGAHRFNEEAAQISVQNEEAIQWLEAVLGEKSEGQ